MQSKLLSRSLLFWLSASVIFIPQVVSAESSNSPARVNSAGSTQQAARSVAGGEGQAKVIVCSSWVDPLNPPRAALLCIHGLGLNRGAYRNFATRMSRRGIATYAIDVRGFGSWMDARDKAKLDFEGSLEDVRDTLKKIHKEHPDLPVFLLGESMGGAIALRATTMYPELIQGLISAVPAGDRFDQKKQDLKVAVESLKGPWHRFDVGTSIVDQATQNKKLAAIWENDPLNRMDLSPMQLMHFQRFMNDNIDAASTIKTVPVLMVQGTLDNLVRPEGTWDIFSALSNRDKALIAFPSEHLIFEYGRAKPDALVAKAAQVAANWIYEHIPNYADVPLAYTAMNSRLAVDASQSSSVNAMAITPEDASAPMQKAMDLYTLGKFDDSLKAFQEVEKAEPENFRARLWLALCYEKLMSPKEARSAAFQARDLARDADQRLRANRALMQLFDDPAAQSERLAVKVPEITDGRPTVLLFSARWCEESKGDDALVSKAKGFFGGKGQYKQIDVEEPSGAAIARQFNVGPLPTRVFLSADGTERLNQFGSTSFANFKQVVDSILTESVLPPSELNSPAGMDGKGNQIQRD
jgi:acylglycerol lipase